jgi:hypothetical protein
MTSMQDTISANVSNISELEGSVVDARRILKRSNSGTLNASLSDPSFINQNYRVPVFTNYFSNRLQGSELRSSVVPSDRLTYVLSSNASPGNEEILKDVSPPGQTFEGETETIRSEGVVEVDAEHRIGVKELSDAQEITNSLSVLQRQSEPAVADKKCRNDDSIGGTASDHVPSEAYLSVATAIGPDDTDLSFRSRGAERPNSEHSDDGAMSDPPSPSSPNPESESQSDRGRSPAHDDARSIDEASSDGEITMGPRYELGDNSFIFHLYLIIN